MSFLNTLGKIAKFSGEVFIGATNEHINKIDEMSDDEIERRFHQPAEEVRKSVDAWHSAADNAQMCKDRGEMEWAQRAAQRERIEAQRKQREEERRRRMEEME